GLRSCSRNRSASLRASILSLLFPCLSSGILRGLQTRTSVTCGLSKSYSQAAQVPSSKVTNRLPRSPAKNSRIVDALVSRMDSMMNLPWESITATEIVAWWTSSPIYFSPLIEGAPFVGDHANDDNLLQRGRPL